ncbi:protein-export chaperone SecB [Pseudothermotoga elfii]
MPTLSRFQMTNYKINEFSLKQDLSKLKPEKPINHDVARFSPEINISKTNENVYFGKVALTIDINVKQGRYVIKKIHIVITGNFTANNTNEEEFRKICSLSGVINLLSLARSYIASATSLAGGPPVILPFIDLTSK